MLLLLGAAVAPIRLELTIMETRCAREALMVEGENLGAWRCKRKMAQLPNAPRPPSQASVRPSFEVMHTRKLGRDVGLAESGFRPAITGLSFRITCDLL
jgi:hypothetical protein